jgi:hypothetical protein
MTRLKFDGKMAEIHSSTGLMFVPGEADYPDEHVASLLATGRFQKAQPPREPKHAAKEKE